jgi:class 3 adenylate cyclase
MTEDESQQDGEATEGLIRMDFVIEDPVFSADGESMTFRFVPDPARYERRKIGGEGGWFDPIDSTFITDSAVADLLRLMPGKPMTLQRPQIDDAREYARARRASVASRLRAGVTEASSDASGDFLDSLALDELGFAILVVDLVGSTRLSQELPLKQNARVISAVVSELADAVPQFHGHVLKYTGDGLIAYFAEPSFARKNDMAIDCAMTMTLLMREAINPALNDEGLPALDLRIGLESGQAVVTVVGTADSKVHRDLIGETINLAAKIQALAAPGQVLVGGSMDRSLHTFWRLVLRPHDPGVNWLYRTKDGRPYPVLKVVSEAKLVPRGAA